MSIIRTIVLLIAMLVNSAVPTGSLYTTFDGTTVRCINEKEATKYEKIVVLCDKAANKDAIDTYEEEDEECNFKLYYINKSYIVGHQEDEEVEIIAIIKDEVIIKGIMTYKDTGKTYDLMDLIDARDVTGIKDLI